LNLQDFPPKKRDKLGIVWVIFLLLSISLLCVSFFWVLFFSPTGQSETVQVDFNEFLTTNAPVTPPSDQSIFHVAIASMISPQHTFEVYGELVEYLGERIRKRPKVIQRRTYREVNDLLVAGRIDLAFVCTGPYLQIADKGKVTAIVVPIVHGKNHYHAYIIVHRRSPYQSFGDLKGKTFVFMDPDSLTGSFYPNSLLRRINETPETFFRDTVLTRNHTDSIHAVSYELADGASVSSVVYDYYQKLRPEKTKDCRILEVSEPLGMPPVLVGANVSETLKERIRQTLLHMHEDPYGKQILERMNVDSYVPAETIRELYEKTKEFIPTGMKPKFASPKGVER